MPECYDLALVGAGSGGIGAAFSEALADGGSIQAAKLAAGSGVSVRSDDGTVGERWLHDRG